MTSKKHWFSLFSRWRNVDNDSADVTSAGKSFQICGLTVDSLTLGTTRRLVTAERRDRRPGWSATRLGGPRYCGSILCKTLYAGTAILNWTHSGTRSQCRQTKASSTPATIGLLATITIVAVFGDYKRNSVTSICCGFVVPTSRTDTSRACCVGQKSWRRRRRRTCEQHKCVDSLVLFTSPTTLCVVPVTCN